MLRPLAARSWVALLPLLAAPLAGTAHAEIRTYLLDGDQSNQLPSLGVPLRPGAVSGEAVIDDPGTGISGLLSLELRIEYTDVLDGSIFTGLPGTTILLDNLTLLGPAPGQAGTGTTATSISWGTLSGWTQTGRLICVTNLLGGGGPPPSACIPFLGFEGAVDPLPLQTDAFASDPWVFSGDGESFGPTPSIETVNLSGGLLRENILWRGTLFVEPIPSVPALSIAATAAAAALLAGLGARALRRRDRARVERPPDGR